MARRVGRGFWKQASIAALFLGVCMGIALAAGLMAPARAGVREVSPDLRSVDPAGLKKGLESFRGKVVLVNFWATWCPPCVAEFPDLVKLHNTYESKGLVVMSVSVDELDDKGAVIDFLRKSKARFPVFMRGKGDIERFVGGIDKKWNGAVPATYFFGADGRQIGKAHTGLMTYEELRDKVESILK